MALSQRDEYSALEEALVEGFPIEFWRGTTDTERLRIFQHIATISVCSALWDNLIMLSHRVRP